MDKKYIEYAKNIDTSLADFYRACVGCGAYGVGIGFAFGVMSAIDGDSNKLEYGLDWCKAGTIEALGGFWLSGLQELTKVVVTQAYSGLEKRLDSKDEE